MTSISSAEFESCETLSLARLFHARDLTEEVRRFSRVSEWRGLAGVARQWLIVGLTVAGWRLLAPHLTEAGAIGVYLVCAVIIATRQHCFLALMHEGTHYRLSRHRAWNDFLSDMFCAFPMGVSTELYRRQHLQHHAYINTDKDPYWVGMQSHEDWRWPKDQVAALKLFACDLFGLAGHKFVLLFLNWSPARSLLERQLKLSAAERLRLVAFLGCTIAVLTAFHLWLTFLLFWVIPGLSVLTAMVRMRSVAEHLVLDSDHELNSTRHVESNFIERQLIAPMNMNYHVVHHLYPSIPFYHLPAVHRVLMRYAAFRENAHITPNYWGMRRGVWAEITGRSAK